jgi:general secretion pathway protein A
VYLDFYGLNREPFHITPDPEFLYLSPSHKEAFATILYGVEKRKGFIAVTGEVGTGKTTILRAYMEQLSSTPIRPIYLFDPGVSFEELLEAMLNELGMRGEDRSEFAKLQWLRWHLIEEFKQNHNVALLIDEAQNMPMETLERLRILSNVETTKEKLIQIVLVGQPELEAKLAQPSLRQLNDRIAVRAKIRPLNWDESLAYISHRLAQAGGNPEVIFTPGALKRIIKHSGGIPRRLNILCDNTLVAGLGAHRRPIPASLVDEVSADLRGSKARPYLKKAAPVAAGLLAVAGLALVGWNMGGRESLDAALPVDRGVVSAPAGSASPTPIEGPAPVVAVTEAPVASPPPVKPADVAAPLAQPAVVEARTVEEPETLVAEPVAAEPVAPAPVEVAVQEPAPLPAPDADEPAVSVAAAAPVAVAPVVSETAVVSETPQATAVQETEVIAAAEPKEVVAAVPADTAVPEVEPRAEVARAALETKPESPKTETETAGAGRMPALPGSVARVAPEANPVTGGASSVRVIERGDSLSKLTRNVYGTANRKLIDEVVKLNPRIQDPDLIYFGDRIVFPALEPSAADKGAASAAPLKAADSQRSEP